MFSYGILSCQVGIEKFNSQNAFDSIAHLDYQAKDTSGAKCFCKGQLALDCSIFDHTFSPLDALNLAASLAKILALLASDFALASEIGDSAIIKFVLKFSDFPVTRMIWLSKGYCIETQ